MEGTVVGLIDAGLFLQMEDVFTGYLPSRRLEDDHFRADPLGVSLIGTRTGRRIRLGDRLEVRAVRIEPLRGRVELEPVSGAAPARRPPATVPRSRRGRPAGRGR